MSSKIRVTCYIDGFNLYHAIDGLCRIHRGTKDHLKWVDLWKLTAQFTDPAVHEIKAINYFSAYMTWSPDREARHREYVKALMHYGVKPVLGRFKEKDAFCKSCKSNYKAREEKESDVNIATHLISDAYEDKFDQAILISNDSDLLGPLKFIKAKFPAKKLKIIVPLNRRHSKELWALATHRASIGESHLQASLLPEQAIDALGNIIFKRPKEYKPGP